YGDFARRTATSGGGQYDMSEMTPEVWWSLSSGQREEITSGNRVNTYRSYYLLGEDYDGDVDPALGDDGYGYVYVNPDGSSLYFQSSSIAYMDNADFGETVINGDFADLTSEMAEEYQANPPTANLSDPWYDMIEGTTPVTDEAYAP